MASTWLPHLHQHRWVFRAHRPIASKGKTTSGAHRVLVDDFLEICFAGTYD